MRRWPQLIATCMAAAGLVAIFQGATGAGLGYSTAVGCLVFATMSSGLATVKR